MKKETQLIDKKLITTIDKESKRFGGKTSGRLEKFLDNMSKMGIESKSSYNLPLRDTIGKTLREKMQYLYQD